MSQQGPSGNVEAAVRRHSGWLVPLALLALTTALGALILFYYLAPNPGSLTEEHASPSARTNRVLLKVGNLSFFAPANYLPYASERSGGPRREIAFRAILPDFRGFTDLTAGEFAGNGPNSRVIHILITREDFDVGESARLERIYLNEVVNRLGKPAPAGLVGYAFKNDSGYRGEDLFVGKDSQGTVVMRCTRQIVDVPSPNCMREVALAPGVLLSYRFKRSRIGQWRLIAAGVEQLVHSFISHSGAT
ncbi:MAG TPA: hypothetical protein VGK90_06065 [Rhizomicrobium sp.]|jgi:hypothetical protein